MKMVMAIVRPEKLAEVEERLKEAGFPSLTEVSVRGRGKQKGITIGQMKYDKLPKEMLLIVCADRDVERIVDIITTTARTGNIGDGKVFVINVDEVITIRTALRGEEAL